MDDEEKKKLKSSILKVWIGFLLLPFIFFFYVSGVAKVGISDGIMKLLLIIYMFIMLIISLILIHITYIDK